MIPLTRPTRVRELLEQLGLRPSKALGQNFLIDRNILDIIIGAAGLLPSDHVLEVGPGLGVLTHELATRSASVTAIEKDHRLYEFLSGPDSGLPGVTFVCADALDVDMGALLAGGVTKVVSNLPYAAGTRVMLNLVRCAQRPQTMVLMVQREVADRMAADCENDEYGLLSLLVRTHYDVTRVQRVGGRCFYPPPDVESVVVKLERHGRCGLEEGAFAGLWLMARATFEQRRKQMRKTLAGSDPACRISTPDVDAALLEAAGNSTVRPDGLSVAGWWALTRALRARPGWTEPVRLPTASE